MKKAIIDFFEENSYVNIPADRLAFDETGNYLEVFKDEAMVGVFDMGVVRKAYISEKGE